jgi:putative aldouronate transport system substrate-binding protein
VSDCATVPEVVTSADPLPHPLSTRAAASDRTTSKEIETNKSFVPLVDYPVGGTAGQTALPHQTIVWPFGIHFDTTSPSVASTEVINLLKTPELKELLDTVREWNKKGYYNRDLMAKDQTNINYEKDGGCFLSWFGYFPYYEFTKSQSYGYEIQVVPMGKQLATTQSQTGAMHAISIVSKNPERSMMFLNLLNSDPYLRNLLAYGIEGVHYDLVGGRVSFGNRTDDQRYAPNTVMQGNNLLLMLGEKDPADKWEFFNNFNKNAVASPLLGFFPDLKPVEAELAVINNVVQEYQDYLWNGTSDPAVHLPEYIKKVDNAGAEKVRLEIQRQVDEWLKSK